MNDPRVRLPAPRPAPPQQLPRRPVGRYLVEVGLLTPRDLLHALGLQKRWSAPLGEILVAEGLVDPSDVLDAVAAQNGLHRVDLDADPPDPALMDLLPTQAWLTHRVVPWMRLGSSLVLASAWPDRIEAVRRMLPETETVLSVVAADAQVMEVISHSRGTGLARLAENRVARRYSSRTWKYRGRRFGVRVAAILCALMLLAWLNPLLMGQILCALAVLTLIPVAGLKLCAFLFQLFGRLHDPPPAAIDTTAPLPKISVLVPLYHETEIASALITRLRRLTYPKALLDVILVLEEKDTVTRRALEATALPHWMQAIEVPDTGPLTTKPRALNYALDFCRGDIVGVWDAEDAPAPDQLEQVAARFDQAGPEVACLQGVLDYYNPRSNWLARCFTIEYAGWFRVLLPGLYRLGLPLPLGGTTLFVRRDVLETLGAWDAHNVTEDADLGMRLAREGYRTELIATTTHEEANYRLIPWIKQRSRWLKGFMVTWLVHMRHPSLLRRQLGWWRCLGLHAMMAGTVAQFAFAPVLWSFWLLVLGLPHPLDGLAGTGILTALFVLCVTAELGNLAIGAAGVFRPSHRFLLPYVPTLPAYSALGAIAAFKALYELLMKPYFWDKTQHGLAAPEIPPAPMSTYGQDHPANPPPAEDGS